MRKRKRPGILRENAAALERERLTLIALFEQRKAKRRARRTGRKASRKSK